MADIEEKSFAASVIETVKTVVYALLIAGVFRTLFFQPFWIPSGSMKDSLLIGDKCGAHTVPYIEVKNNSSRVEHEATTSKVDDDQLFYCRSRGMDEEEAVALVVNGFCKEVLQALPMEFAMEAQALVAISLEGSVG